MLLPETTKRLQTKTINGQTIPEDGFCYNFGFCINSCKYRPTCPVVRTKFLLHCIIVDEKNHSYYPIQYSNEIPLIPEEIRAETTIVDTCYKDGCDMPLFSSRMFNDTYVKYAVDSGKTFKIFCSQQCMDEYENELLEDGYKCSKIKPKP